MKWRFIYRGMKARYRDQKLELQALIHALKPDDIAVDVGANKGSYLWSLSRAVPQGKVIAFEPQPLLVQYLNKACEVSGLRNVEIIGKGVSDQQTVLTLAVPGGGITSPGASFEEAVKQREEFQSYEVETITLDQYFHHSSLHIGAIKIDVEGHELAVIRGAREILVTHRPVVVCESEQRHMSQGSVKDLFNLMNELGYEGQFVDDGYLRPVSEFVPAIHQSEIGDRYWDQPHYCNNFIFKPKI